MGAQLPALFVLGAEAVAHQFGPDFARRAVLRDLFEEIVMRIEEEAEAGSETIHGKAAFERPIDIFDAVAQSECQLLHGGGSSFANMIAADGNRIETRNALGGIFDNVSHQAHGGSRRKNVFLLRDVFLEDVVLQGARHARPIHALLFADREIHGPQNGRGRIDGH